MAARDRWLLPEGVEEILPDEAYRLECLRRRTLDMYSSWGYEFVITPLIEFLDSLLVGSSHDLDLHTFKITDQLTGRMMGIRADITPQVARIDAHWLSKKEGSQSRPVRLCYADNVLHTKPRGLLASRTPIRIGAELFGHAGVTCDIELICLMYETMKLARIGDVHIVLGHVGIFRSLVQLANLSTQHESELFDATQRKSYEEIDLLLVAHVADEDVRVMLRKLTHLHGDESVLAGAALAFDNAPTSVKAELMELDAIARGVRQRLPHISLGFDLCELRGYEYHTGIVFAAYTPDYGRAVAQGGRYNEIGSAFGRSRPASGFDADLKVIARLSHADIQREPAIFAPLSQDTELITLIAHLRERGERVIENLDPAEPELKALHEFECNRCIVRVATGWEVIELN
jgi:ATP phosphoribosyltransferase regulatory subunit